MPLGAIRNIQIKARNRPKGARVPRSVARITAPAKPAIDSRKVDRATSSGEALLGPAQSTQADRWCATRLPACRRCDEVAPPATQREWRCTCSPRHPQARFACQPPRKRYQARRLLSSFGDLTAVSRLEKRERWRASPGKFPPVLNSRPCEAAPMQDPYTANRPTGRAIH